MKIYSLSLQGQGGQNVVWLPAKFKVYGSRYTAWLLIILSVIFGLEPICNILSWLSLQPFSASYISFIDIYWSISFLIFVGFSISLFSIDGDLKLDNVMASCKYKTLFRLKSWNVPISSYRGLEIKRRLEGVDGSMSIVWAIRLVHPDKDKSLTLRRDSTAEYLKEDMVTYQQMFNLPNISNPNP